MSRSGGSAFSLLQLPEEAPVLREAAWPVFSSPEASCRAGTAPLCLALPASAPEAAAHVLTQRLSTAHGVRGPPASGQCPWNRTGSWLRASLPVGGRDPGSLWAPCFNDSCIRSHTMEGQVSLSCSQSSFCPELSELLFMNSRIRFVLSSENSLGHFCDPYPAPSQSRLPRGPDATPPGDTPFWCFPWPLQ